MRPASSLWRWPLRRRWRWRTHRMTRAGSGRGVGRRTTTGWRGQCGLGRSSRSATSAAMPKGLVSTFPASNQRSSDPARNQRSSVTMHPTRRTGRLRESIRVVRVRTTPFRGVRRQGHLAGEVGMTTLGDSYLTDRARSSRVCCDSGRNPPRGFRGPRSLTRLGPRDHLRHHAAGACRPCAAPVRSLRFTHAPAHHHRLSGSGGRCLTFLTSRPSGGCRASTASGSCRRSSSRPSPTA